MNDLQKAQAWFESKGIEALIQDGCWIEIVVNGIQIQISEAETEWRSVMWDTENS